LDEANTQLASRTDSVRDAVLAVVIWALPALGLYLFHRMVSGNRRHRRPLLTDGAVVLGHGHPLDGVTWALALQDGSLAMIIGATGLVVSGVRRLGRR
jgi:hypothetical protein